MYANVPLKGLDRGQLSKALDRIFDQEHILDKSYHLHLKHEHLSILMSEDTSFEGQGETGG
jgi:hypothetical protein